MGNQPVKAKPKPKMDNFNPVVNYRHQRYLINAKPEGYFYKQEVYQFDKPDWYYRANDPFGPPPYKIKDQQLFAMIYNQ